MGVAIKSRHETVISGDVTPEVNPMLAHRITNRDPKTGRVCPKYDGVECSIADCRGRAAARGWCRDHYKRWWYDGNPEGFHLTFLQKFWSRVDFTNEHWLWVGAKTKGYGCVARDGHRHYAHRIAYEMLVGPIPEGLEIDHLCRTPACIWPEHLEPVSHRENMRRHRELRVA